MDQVSQPAVDTRLERAAELAAYLRDHPRDGWEDAEELAQRFKLAPDLVSQIQVSSRSNVDRPKATRRDPRVREFFVRQWSSIRSRCVSATDNPPIFLVALAVIVGAIGIPNLPSFLRVVAASVWIAGETTCLLVKPKFRYVLWGTVAVFLVATAKGEVVFRSRVFPSPFDSIGGHLFFAALLGFTFALMNVLLGGALVVVGGSLQVAMRKRADARQSRQDLLSRMFYLQQELRNSSQVSERPPSPIVIGVRKRLFWWALGSSLFLSCLSALSPTLFHIKVDLIHPQAHTVASGPGGTIRVAELPYPLGYLAMQMAISFLATASLITFGTIANSWRKVRDLCCAELIGQVVSTFLMVLSGTFGKTLPLLELMGSGLATNFGIVLLVRFSVWFTRILTRYRIGGETDDSTVISELLDIRFRLSANPVPVYVLVVDAAGSTQMKRNSDPLMVEYSFGRYQNWIRETVIGHQGKVELTTGDGAICAFSDVENAMKAAREIQQGISQFNSSQNKLDSPFRLRVALHAGTVVADLEKVQFTEVIDVAAHVEKYSPVGGIAMTAPFLEGLAGIHGFDPISQLVDGIEVFSMTPEALAT